MGISRRDIEVNKDRQRTHSDSQIFSTGQPLETSIDHSWIQSEMQGIYWTYPETMTIIPLVIPKQSG